MVMWRSELDPHIKVLPSTSPAVLPIILSIPGLAVTAHIAIYLPTSGREAEFVTAISDLEAVIEHIKEEFNCPIYI